MLQYLPYIGAGLYILIALFVFLYARKEVKNGGASLLALALMCIVWPLTFLWFLWDMLRGRVA